MSTIAALEASILAKWRAEGLETTSRTAERLARLAAIDVVDALRHNPAWARGLGIGPETRP